MNKNFEIKVLTQKEFYPLYNQYKEAVFDDDHSFALYDLISDEEKEKMKQLTDSRGQTHTYRIYMAALDKEGNIAGWSWGFEEDSHTYYMCNSAVLPQYRRMGIYSELLKQTIEILKEKGYQKIYSRHCATNNSVLIPKLKAGFVITNMQLDDIFGVLIHLSYFTNPVRRKILDYRSGQLKPDEEIKKVFKM